MPVASNIGTIAIAKQTAKGAYTATPTIKLNLAAAPSLYPVRELGRYSSTGSGRDAGASYTSAVRVEGDFQCYMHPDGMGLLSYLALGANADSGTTPNYTHTATPGLSLPYVTVWRMVGNTIFERYVDCKVTRMSIESSAGAPAMVTIGVLGITSEFQAADTAPVALSSPGLLHMDAKAAFKFSTVAQPLASFSMEYVNGVNAYQADDWLPYDITEGLIDLTGSFRVLFSGPTAFPAYRNFFYGSAAGTQLSVSSTSGQEAFETIWTRTANLAYQINIPQIQYESIPVTPDPAGDPLEVEVAWQANKVGAQAILTALTKDGTATL